MFKYAMVSFQFMVHLYIECWDILYKKLVNIILNSANVS